MDAASIHTCVTSPPYFGLRDYGGQAQIGLEPTPAAYVAEQCAVFDMVRRVLRQDATCWLNLGDSYSTNPGNGRGGETNDGGVPHRSGVDKTACGLASKQLIGIPWRVAFALQDAGWYLRSDIIWAKGNPMPESVTDRPTKAHEYLFLLAKAEKYYYDADAIREPHTDPRVVNGVWTGGNRGRSAPGYVPQNQAWNSADGERGGLFMRDREYNPAGRNKRSVWNVNTQPYTGAHFAVFPEKLIEPCILAGCPAGGIVLDPFAGSGTTGRVAKRLGRRAILIEQNEAYCDMAASSLTQQAMQFEVVP